MSTKDEIRPSLLFFCTVLYCRSMTGKSRMNEMTKMTGVTVISRVTGMTRDKWDIQGDWDD